MSYNLSSVPKLQFFDNDGNPLVGGKLYTYEAGTTTPLATYTDSTGATPNTNPVILDSRGEANVWLAAQSYKFVLKTSTDTTIWTVDNVSNAINVSQILASGGSPNAPPYSFSADTTTGMYLSTVGQLGFSANSVPVLRMSGTALSIGQNNLYDITTTMFGELGINTQLGPDRTFHARTKSAVTSSPVTVGRFEFDSTGTPANGVGAGIEFAARTGVGTYVAGAYIDAPATSVTAAAETFDLAFGTTNAGASAYKVWIKGDGKVGIGTSSPATLLDVIGSSSLNGAVTINEAGADADTRIEGDTDANLVFVDASTDRVGVGTNTPGTKLHVSSGATDEVARFEGTGLPYFSIYDSGVRELYIQAAAAINIFGETNKAMVFYTNSVGRFQLANDGAQSSVIPGGATLYPQFACRAWVNFDGTSGSIGTGRGSGNVSSVTDNGTGDYTINFTTAMPDANYAVTGVAMASSFSAEYIVSTPGTFSWLSSSVRVGVRGGGGGVADVQYVCVAIFR